MTISDGLDDIRAALMALAEDRTNAMEIFGDGRDRIIESIARDSQEELFGVLRREMLRLSRLKRKRNLQDATRISLVGEIYVRRDDFSRQNLIEKLAEHEIVVTTAPVAEWLYYTNYCLSHDMSTQYSLKSRIKVLFKNIFMRKDERAVKEILALSGFYENHMIDINHLVQTGSTVLNPQLAGEAILTLSSAMTEIGDETHGVISIGPFGCMPCRIAESIVSYRLREEKENFSRHNRKFWNRHKGKLPLPFLAIESDGKPFPQLVETRLESLLLSAKRLKEELRKLPN
jgi:predicted nucleotide-binding protein (sugar kinase/HSP70/actin superfamily)